jgi:hypothetical protein
MDPNKQLPQVIRIPKPGSRLAGYGKPGSGWAVASLVAPVVGFCSAFVLGPLVMFILPMACIVGATCAVVSLGSREKWSVLAVVGLLFNGMLLMSIFVGGFTPVGRT